MGVGGGLGAAGILLLVLSFIGLGVGLYYAYMCIQSRPQRKRPYDPEHGPLITADPDVNGNHEDSLVASAPLPYIPKSKIDEPDSNDEKTPLHTKEVNDSGVDKSESVFVPIETEEAVTPTVEEATTSAEATEPVVVIPPELVPEYKEPPKVECPVTKSAESAPTIENGAAPRDCDLPVPIIMNAAFVVAKPITDSDEEDGLLLQKRLHHDDSLDPEPVPPLVPIAHTNLSTVETSAPKEDPSTKDADEPLPSAPPKESTPDAAPDSVLPTAPPKAVTPELPATTDENAQPSAPPEEVTVESLGPSNETKDSHIIDELHPENGVVYLETYKATASDPIDSTRDDSIKEENSSTESSPEELVLAVDPVAIVKDKSEELTESVKNTSNDVSVDSKTSEDQIPLSVDTTSPENNISITPPEISSYGWTAGVVPTDTSSYGWSNNVKKVENNMVKSSVDPLDCNIDKQPPVITEKLPVVTENNRDTNVDGKNMKDEIIIIPPVIEGESLVPLSHDKHILVSTENVSSQIEPELSEESINTSNVSISSEEAVPPYTETEETVKSPVESLDQVVPVPEGLSVITVPNDERSLVGEDELDKLTSPKDTATVIEESETESVANVISKVETSSDKEATAVSALQMDAPREASPNDNISNVSFSSEEAVPPYTETAESVKSSADNLDQVVPAPEGLSVTTVPKDEKSPAVEDGVDKVESSKDTEPVIEELETESVAHVISKTESVLQMEDPPKETSPNDKEAEESSLQIEDSPKVTSNNQEAEAESNTKVENIPKAPSSEQEGESKLAPQVQEPIASKEFASSESSPKIIITEDSEHVSSAEETQPALTEQHITDHSDTESSEPDITEYSFSSGPSADTTAQILEDEVSSSLEPEVTKYRSLPIADDTAIAADPIFVSSVPPTVTITECDADSVSSISLSSDDEADENSEGNKADSDSDSDISLSSDEEETAKVELNKGISDKVTAEETEENIEIAKQKTNKNQDETHSDTESDGAENPNEIKEEVVEVVQVVQEVEDKDEEDNEEEEKEVVNHDVVHQDSYSDDSDSGDDKSTASSNSDDSDAEEVPCVKKSKIPRLKSNQSRV